MLRQMMVSGLTIDPFTNSPIMILKDVDSDKAVPIWIGLLEATAIASELENIKFSRPMTHDLLRNIMECMEIKVTKVEVCDLRDNTYFALIHLHRDGKDISIDARPSDRAERFPAADELRRYKGVDFVHLPGVQETAQQTAAALDQHVGQPPSAEFGTIPRASTTRSADSSISSPSKLFLTRTLSAPLPLPVTLSTSPRVRNDIGCSWTAW